MSFLENTRRPAGLGGKLMVRMMNVGHRALARWGLRFLLLSADAKVLDCGEHPDAPEKMPAGHRQGR